MAGLNATQFALVMVESSGRMRATRYEPGFRRRYLGDLEGKRTESELVWLATSHGLFQVMGTVAAELGWPYARRDEWLSSFESQLRVAGLLWARNKHQLERLLGRKPENWRLVEAWNKGAGGAAAMDGPSDYWHKVLSAVGRSE